MIHKMALWQKIGFFFTVGFGVLLHFLYEWSNNLVWIAPFSGVNESTWEHMKLLFFPAFIFAIIQSFFFKDRNDFWYIKLKGTVLGLVLIPVIFNLFNGIIGKSTDWINIMIFVVSVASLYIYETKLFDKYNELHLSNKSSIFIFILIAILFGVFTFYTPHLEIFLDKSSNSYGLN